MKYQRIKCDAGAFRDIMPEGSYMFTKPPLPTIEWKKNGIKYKATYLSVLNEDAVSVYETILKTLKHGSTDKVTFDASHTDDDKLNLIMDIVCGITWEAEKIGKNKWLEGGFLVYGIEREEDDDSLLISFLINPEMADVIHEYMQDKTEVNMFDMVEKVIGKKRKKHERK